jgi:hypothetical protein
MIFTRFIQELGRQFRLDLKDDKARKQAEEEGEQSDPGQKAEKDDCNEEDAIINKKTPENREHQSAGKLLIGQGQKNRTWIAAPLATAAPVKGDEEGDQDKGEEEIEAVAGKEESKQTEHPSSKP